LGNNVIRERLHIWPDLGNVALAVASRLMPNSMNGVGVNVIKLRPDPQIVGGGVPTM
jgi:hypothetical protein